MTPEPPKPHSGGNMKNPVRVSKRIAEQTQRPKKQDAVLEKPVAPKTGRRGLTGQKQEPLRSKKSAPARPKQPTEKKATNLKPSKAIRVQNVREKTLREHDRRTAHDPLPQDLAKWKPDRVPLGSEFPEDPDDTGSIMTAYDPLMPENLTKYGVFDELWAEDVNDLMAPENLQEIINEITSVQEDISNEAQLRTDYRNWVETILEPNFNEGEGASWFLGYMDIALIEPRTVHFTGTKQQWKAAPDSQIKTWKPNPDFVEGIKGRKLPGWISDALGSYVRPDISSTVAIPNLLAEFKGNGSMKIAHQQARLDGGFAVQGFFRLYDHISQLGQAYEHLKPSGVFLNKAVVGTLEYNAEIIVGNVHWATKSTSLLGRVDYHMRRVMCNFTRGLNFRDFVKIRAEARNFRRYFTRVRERIFNELVALPLPAPAQERYESMQGPDLRTLCKERGIRIGKGLVADMRKRLQQYDLTGGIAASSVSTARSDSQATTINRLVHSPDALSPLPPGGSFNRRRTRSGDELAEGDSQSKRRRHD